MSDKEQIQSVIQTYFDSMFDSSAEKVHAAFHPNAKITGYIGDEFHEMSVTDFAGFVESQQPSPRSKGEAERLDIISLEVAGNTAAARVRDDYLEMTFLDTLSLLKSDGKWSIYNKLFHVEGDAE